jgi:hypothetical protein
MVPLAVTKHAQNEKAFKHTPPMIVPSEDSVKASEQVSPVLIGTESLSASPQARPFSVNMYLLLASVEGSGTKKGSIMLHFCVCHVRLTKGLGGKYAFVASDPSSSQMGLQFH